MAEKGGGRRPGQKDRAPRQTAARKLAELATATGVAPLDVLLDVMRKAWRRAEELEARNAPPEAVAEQREIACVAATRAAPYLHPRLAAVAVQQVPPPPVDIAALNADERRTLHALMLRVMGGRAAIEGKVAQ